MHVTIVGPAVGRPAVALHGLGGSTEQNLPALEAVATHYGLRIHAIDLPNHCRSGKVGILHFQVRHFADLATMALLLNRDTAGILGRLTNLGIQPIVVQGILDQSTPAAAHEWCWQRVGRSASGTSPTNWAAKPCPFGVTSPIAARSRQPYTPR